MRVRAACALAAAACCLACSTVAAAQTARGADVIRTEPGSTPSGAVRALSDAGPPILTYAALGVSVLAVILGGGALALVLLDRRRVDGLADALARRPAPGHDPGVTDRLARVEAVVRDFSIKPADAHQPAVEPAPRPRNDPFPPSASGAPAARTPPTPAAGATPATNLPAWTDQLKARFARLTLDPSSAAASFIADHRPRGAAAGPDGVALLDGFEGAKLWAVRAPGDGEVWALMPGEQAVLNWSAHFAAQRTQVGAEVFGEAFDLIEGGTGLRLEEPALARRDASGRLSVRRRGRLSGFRS